MCDTQRALEALLQKTRLCLVYWWRNDDSAECILAAFVNRTALEALLASCVNFLVLHNSMHKQFSLCRHAPGAAAGIRPHLRPIATRPNLQRRSPVCNVLDMPKSQTQQHPEDRNRQYQKYTAYVLEQQQKQWQQQQQRQAVVAAADAMRNEPRARRQPCHRAATCVFESNSSRIPTHLAPPCTRHHQPCACRMPMADYTQAVFTSQISEASYCAPFRIPDEVVYSHPMIGDG
jgi:hypothetical protein